MSRSQLEYKSQRTEDPKLLDAIIEIKKDKPWYGLPRVHNQLKREGFCVNGKKVHRLMKTLRLLVTAKKKRIKPYVEPKRKLQEASQINDVWAMDFVFDRLSDGTPFRCFTIVDTLSRQVPGILVSKTMAGFLPIDFLDDLKNRGPLPKHFILDNGPEFANHAFIAWCEKNDISLHFIDPGKPVQNGYIESFNGKFRQEFLAQNSFRTIADVRTKLTEWTKYYNDERPHSSLDYMTPKEFADQQASVLDRKNNLLVLKTG